MVATLTNNASRPIRHVGVLVGGMEYEYDFKEPLQPHQTVRNIVGSEFREPEDNLRIACESSKPPADCAEMSRKGYKMAWPAGAPTLSPVTASEEGVHLGAVDECWARLIVYADGSVWSVSPL